MRKLSYMVCALLFATCIAELLPADEELSSDVVLAMMSRVPSERSGPHGKPAGYEHSGDARGVARGIATAAANREQAAMLVVTSAYESANDPHARGDCDRVTHDCPSKGAFQLKNVREEIADDPAQAARVWLSLAADAEMRCSANPPEERLAVLASGSCNRARGKARRRAETARAIVW